MILGWLVIAHALLKFTEKGGDKAFQRALTFLHDVPFPAFTGAVLPWVEFVFGALLILGALTRVVTLLLGVEMLIIAFLVKLHDVHVGVIAPPGAVLPGAEVEFALTAGFLILFFMGPGRASADRLLGLEGRGITTAVRESAQAQAPMPRALAEHGPVRGRVRHPD